MEREREGGEEKRGELREVRVGMGFLKDRSEQMKSGDSHWRGTHRLGRG